MKPSRLPNVRRISTHTWHRAPLRKRVADFLCRLLVAYCGH